MYPNPTSASRRITVRALLPLALGILSGHAQTAPAPSQNEADDKAVLLDPLRVNADTNTGYGAQLSSSSSRLNLRYIDVPQTLNVVTEELLRDAFIFDSREFSMYVPGITPTSNTHQEETYFVRGLTTTTSYVEGFLAARPVNRDAGLYNRVEYVKGPASAAIGRGEAGGLINFVQKKPLAQRQLRATTIFGTDYFYRGELDYNDRITSSGSVRYRLPMYYESSDNPRGHGLLHTEKYGIGPAFTWTPFARTEITLTTAYFNNTTPGAVASAFWMNKDITDSQVETNAINPAIWYPGPNTPLVSPDVVFTFRDNFRTARVSEANLIVNQKIGDHWSLRQGFRAERILNDVQRFNSPPAVTRNAAMPSGYQIGMVYVRNHDDVDGVRSQTDLVYENTFLRAKHTFLAGYDIYENHGLNQTGQRTGYNVDLYHPDLTPPPGFDPKTAVAINANGDTTNLDHGYGYYGQYSGSYLRDRLQVIAGWRKDHTSSDLYNRRNRAFTSKTANTDVPRYSVGYKPTTWSSFYVLHSEQADPPEIKARYTADVLSGGATSYTDGRRPRNEQISGAVEGRLNEAGVKADLWGSKLTASLAYFDMRRNGFLKAQNKIEVGANGRGTISYTENYVADGEHVHGWETTVFGQPTRNLTMVFSAIFQDGTNPRADGSLSKMPKPTQEVSFNGKYSFRDRDRNGFEVTAGGKVWFGGWTMAIEGVHKFHDDQYVLDSGVAYYWGRGRFSVRARVNNVMDDVIFIAGNSQYSRRRAFISFSTQL